MVASLSRCTRLPRLFRTRKRLTFPIRSGRFGSFAVNLTVPFGVASAYLLAQSIGFARCACLRLIVDWPKYLLRGRDSIYGGRFNGGCRAWGSNRCSAHREVRG